MVLILFPLLSILVWHFPFWFQFPFEALTGFLLEENLRESSRMKLQSACLVCFRESINHPLFPNFYQQGLLTGENLRELGSLFICQLWEKLLSWLLAPSLCNFIGDFQWLILPVYLPNSPTDAKVQDIKLKDIKALIQRVTFLKRKTNLKIFSVSVNS